MFHRILKHEHLSWECGWCLLLNDCLRLSNTSLSLSNLAASMSVELQPGVVSISDHRAEAEESSSSVSTRCNSRNTNSGDEIKQRPNSTENKLDLYPRNPEESLNDMKDVEHKQDTRKPEGNHRHRVEEGSALQARVLGDFNANESQKTEYLMELT